MVRSCSERSENLHPQDMRVPDIATITNKHYVKTLAGCFDLLQLVDTNPQNYPYLLETTAKSTQQQSNTARYNILFAFPQNTLIKKTDGRLFYDEQELIEQEFLCSLDSYWRQHRNRTITEIELPFTGGWFIYAAYELVAEIESGLELPTAISELPVAMAARIPAAIIYDHVTDKTTIIAEPGYKKEFEQLEQDLLNVGRSVVKNINPVCISLNEEDPRAYRDSVQRVLDYIHDGDVFQVNLSRLWQGKLETNRPLDIYRQLCSSNPAPFAGYVCFEQGAIISSSPERLVSVRNNKVETRPIAGTRPRGNTEQSDTGLQTELITHPKERAEHVMLIDLERNDLGRLSIPGSVQVDECMIIESYAHVHHIVSNISGQLCADITPGQVIRAVFPGGTITGCPKVRCMEIIAELEQMPRGPYTGSIGYLNHNGDMDLNILIRSVVVDGDQLSFRAGAGLVADSNADKELEETRAKARGMLLALSGEGCDE